MRFVEIIPARPGSTGSPYGNIPTARRVIWFVLAVWETCATRVLDRIAASHHVDTEPPVRCVRFSYFTAGRLCWGQEATQNRVKPNPPCFLNATHPSQRILAVMQVNWCS